MNIGVTSLDFDKKYTIKNFLLRRFKRTGVPFIVWSFIGIFFHMIVKKRLIMYKMTTLIAGIINARWMGIYWFFIPLFMVYISIPVINSNFEHKFYLCTLKIQYLAFIQLSMFSKLCRLQLRF